MNTLQMAVAILGLVGVGVCVWHGSFRATAVVGAVAACLFLGAGLLW